MNTRDWGRSRFGNPQKLIKIKEKDGKFPRGYVQDGNKLYKVTVSPANKEGAVYWVSLEEMSGNSGQRGYNNYGRN